MSIPFVKGDKGVTVVTVVTDKESLLPPLRPLCCSVNKAMTGSCVIRALGVRGIRVIKMFLCSDKTDCDLTVLHLLQTVQIMVGVFNVGLGPERTDTYPYWLGVLVKV